MKRILTAILLLPILLYTVWNDFPYYFVALTGLAVAVGLYEFYSFASRLGLHPHSAVGYAAGICVVACFALRRAEWIIPLMAALVIVSLSISVFREGEFTRTLASVSATVFGVIYIALLAGFLVGLRMMADTQVSKLAAKLLTMFFAMVMMTDTGAYYTGRTLGRHKLAPRVSPGKTIEGSIGGFISAALAGVVCRQVFYPEIALVHALVLGAIIGAVSHGGMLDRIDSILFCAPVIYFYSQWFL
jgi:phosphatidate cytidylyltransferase